MRKSAGCLIKFSHQEYLFKPYEGQINLAGMNSVNGDVRVNNICPFLVT